MAPTQGKLRKCASGDEIMQRWKALSLKHRREVLTFKDRGLVNGIVVALGFIQSQHEACLEAGLKLCSEEESPFDKSILLGDILSMKAKGHKIDEYGHNVVDTSTYILEVADSFLERDDVLEELRLVLPDFLEPGARSRRRPMPMPRWKQLWEVLPASFEILEQQLAQTMEQAFWTLGTDPKWCTKDSNGVAGEEAPKEVALEAWMIDDTSAKTSRKVRKKKNKAGPLRCNSIGSELSLQTTSTCYSFSGSDDDLSRQTSFLGTSPSEADEEGEELQSPLIHSEVEPQVLQADEQQISVDLSSSLRSSNDVVEDHALVAEGGDAKLAEDVQVRAVGPPPGLEQHVKEIAIPAELSATPREHFVLSPPPGLLLPLACHPEQDLTEMFMMQQQLEAASASPLDQAGSVEPAYMWPAYQDCNQSWNLRSMLATQQQVLLQGAWHEQLASFSSMQVDEWLVINNFSQYREHILKVAGDICDLTEMQDEDCVELFKDCGMPKLAARRFRKAVRLLGAIVSE